MENGLFSIRQVIELTGVSEYVLRAWELRYSALAPKRTETGRRLYSKNDLEKARVLWELTQRDHKISEIARLTLSELKKILANAKIAQLEDHQSPSSTVKEILNSVQDFDWENCRKILLTQRKRKKLSPYIHELILPLIKAIGAQVASQNLSIAQEHILSSFIKENLNALSVDQLPTRPSIRMVFACPEGDMHEIGLLIALSLARSAGVSTLFLGPNTPKADLCDSALKFKATHILISSTISKNEGAKEDFLKYLSFIDQQLPKNIKIWLAGRNVESGPFTLDRAHEKIDSFVNFEKLLN